MTCDEGEPTDAVTAPRTTWPPWLRGAALAAGLVLAALVWLVGLRSSAPVRPAGERTAGLRVACSGDGARCSRRAELRLFVSNGGRFRHVFAVGLDDRLVLHWYAPRPPDVVSAVAPTVAAAKELPIGAAIALADHVPGPLRVFALFTDAPLSAQELTAATAELKSSGRAPSTLQSLPLARTDVLQKSVLLNLE